MYILDFNFILSKKQSIKLGVFLLHRFPSIKQDDVILEIKNGVDNTSALLIGQFELFTLLIGQFELFTLPIDNILKS